MLVRGINVISNPFVIGGVIGLMLLTGWLTAGELTPLLFTIAGAYLVLAVLGGYMAKRSKQTSTQE